MAKGTEVSFYRAFVVSKNGRRWQWRHENDGAAGMARTKFDALAAVDDWYDGRSRGVTINNGASPREIAGLFAAVLVIFILSFVLLAFRTGGF
jgi:hypothetical protein